MSEPNVIRISAGVFLAVKLDVLREQLAGCDLRVISMAEQAVLDAMANARIVIDPHHNRPIFEHSEDELVACEAELGRRGMKP